MKSEILSQKQNGNSNSINNYYILKYNENLSTFISNEIELYKKNKNKEILKNSIFFNEELLNLIFISYSNNSYFLTAISVTSQENKIKERQLIIPKGIFFKFGGNIELSEDEKHIVIFNEEKNKLFIIFNYIQKINLNEKIILDNYYENKEDNIINIKFNNLNLQNDGEKSLAIDKDIIVYGINCTNNNLSLFNNKYLNKEFQIYFNEPFIDFQIINNDIGGYDLYIMGSYGNFKFIKNINDFNNIPKSDKSELFQKIKIYNKIAHNINNSPYLFKNEYIKFNIQIQNNINEKIEGYQNIINVLRCSKNMVDIGVLINGKLFIIKKYYLGKEEENDDDSNNEEVISDIIPINNIINKYIIKTNYNIYFLDIPSLFNLCLILKGKNNDKNPEQAKQELLFLINEIISKINLRIILKLSSNNNNIPSIIYNFYKGSILFIKEANNTNIIIRIYDFEIETPNLCEKKINQSNNFIIHEKNNEQKLNEEKLAMENLLKKLKIEIEQLKEKYLNSLNKNEYINKVIEEFSFNINNIINNNNISRNIDNYLNQINEWYKNLYMSIILYGEKIKNEDDYIKQRLIIRNKMENNLKKDEENIENIKKRIDNKLKKIEENENKIIQLRNHNNNIMYENYLKNMNNINEGKIFSNELIGRVNDQTIKNIKYFQETIQNNRNYEKVSFEQINNFPLTMKYLNNAQNNDMNYVFSLIKNLLIVLMQFRDNIKKQENI